MSFLPPAILSSKGGKLPVAMASSGPMPGPKPSNTVLLPPALIAGAARAAGGAGAGAGAEMEPALRAKKRGARASKSEKIAEKLAEHRHKISAALAALVEADATKAEVAKYFKMRVEQLADEEA